MKAKRKRTPEERAEDRDRGERVERMLKERIEYHRSRLLDEGRSPQTLEERIAYHERKAAEEQQRGGSSAQA